MNNRKAKFLFAKPGQRLRLSNRKVVRYAPCNARSWQNPFYCIGTKRSAAQNRWKNHCYRVESKGAQS